MPRRRRLRGHLRKTRPRSPRWQGAHRRVARGALHRLRPVRCDLSHRRPLHALHPPGPVPPPLPLAARLRCVDVPVRRTPLRALLPPRPGLQGAARPHRCRGWQRTDGLRAHHRGAGHRPQGGAGLPEGAAVRQLRQDAQDARQSRRPRGDTVEAGGGGCARARVACVEDRERRQRASGVISLIVGHPRYRFARAIRREPKSSRYL